MSMTDKKAAPLTKEDVKALALTHKHESCISWGSPRLLATVLALSEARAEVERLKKHAEALAVAVAQEIRIHVPGWFSGMEAALAVYRAEYPEET